MKADGTVIPDKEYELLIPEGLQSTQKTISWSFRHQLNFAGNQKIIILYIPLPHKGTGNKKFNLSKNDLEKLLEKEDIETEFEELHLLKNRRFGLIKIEGENIYAIYLNVKPANVAAFNSSISSLTYR